MYSDSDLDGAVMAGAISADAAAALRAHVAARSRTPTADEEGFRLLTGFNDIFVSIACVLLLAALAGIGAAAAVPFAAALVAATSWGLAEYFTRHRRMALPSIVLLLAFVGAVAVTLGSAVANERVGRWLETLGSERAQFAAAGSIAALIAAATAIAAWAHWRRFGVPITVAAGAVATVGVALALIVGVIPAARDALIPLVLVAGLAMFAFAMRWDLSDRERRTRRADVAFWLHLAAAPMIAHALFHLLGVFGDAMDAGRAVVVLALYGAFALVALAVDRRALLVSSLAYVLYALYALFRQAGAVELSAAFTGLVIGSALLLLSAFWQAARRRVTGLLGDGMAARLPPAAALPA